MLLGGCYSEFFKATDDFGKVAKTSSSELADIGQVVTDLCRTQAELEYLFARVNATRPIKLDDHAGDSSWQAYYEQHTILGATTQKSLTWAAQCAGYEPVDAVVHEGLVAVGAYGDALAQVSSMTYDGADFSSIATSANTMATSLSGGASKYKPAISGVGDALGKLSSVLLSAWVAKKAGELVTAGDAPLQSETQHLAAFVEVVKKEQLADARAKLDEVITAIEVKRNMVAIESKAPPFSDPLAVESQLQLELRWRGQLDQTEAKLNAFADALQKLSKAHSKLKDAWAHHTEPCGKDDIKALAGLGAAVLDDINAFRHPQKGDAK